MASGDGSQSGSQCLSSGVEKSVIDSIANCSPRHNSRKSEPYAACPCEGFRIRDGGKCEDVNWSDKVPRVDEVLTCHCGPMDISSVDGEREKCECRPRGCDEKGPPDSREAQVDIDGQLGFLETLLEGNQIPLDATVSMDTRPDWFDQEKVDRGRKFAVKYLLAVIYAEMVSLAFLLSMKGSVQALVFTGKSHTPLTAFKRYMSTVLRVMTWYEDDVWRGKGEAWRNLQVVRNMHASVSRRMNWCEPEELSRQTTLEGRGIGMLSSPERNIQKDYERSLGKADGDCPFAEAASLGRVGASGRGGAVHLNQVELSITQFGFMGLVVLYPEKFGVYGATDEDLEGFIHLWRSLGYCLGIKDKYNFCSGNLQETRQRCKLVLDKWMKPIMSEATREWEHMYRCVVEGTNYYVGLNTYGGSLLYLSWVLGVETPRLLAASNWLERFTFKLQKLVFIYFCKMYWVMAFVNFLLRIALWRGRKLSTVWFESLEKKASSRYEKVEKGFSTRL